MQPPSDFESELRLTLAAEADDADSTYASDKPALDVPQLALPANEAIAGRGRHPDVRGRLHRFAPRAQQRTIRGCLIQRRQEPILQRHRNLERSTLDVVLGLLLPHLTPRGVDRGADRRTLREAAIELGEQRTRRLGEQ